MQPEARVGHVGLAVGPKIEDGAPGGAIRDVDRAHRRGAEIGRGGAAEHVADHGHVEVPGIKLDGRDVAGLLVGRVGDRGRRELARRVVAEVGQVAGRAMGDGCAHVGRVVAFHQLHVREGAVRVDVDFLPGRGRGPGIVGIVVGDDVAPARDAEHDRLVHVADDVVLDEIVGGATAQDDAVAVVAEAIVGRVVEVRVAHHGAEGTGQRDVHAADGGVGLHVLDPAVCRVGHVDAAGHLAVVTGIGAALDG